MLKIVKQIYWNKELKIMWDELRSLFCLRSRSKPGLINILRVFIFNKSGVLNDSPEIRKILETPNIVARLKGVGTCWSEYDIVCWFRENHISPAKLYLNIPSATLCGYGRGGGGGFVVKSIQQSLSNELRCLRFW